MASLVVTVETPDAPARELVFQSSPVRLGRGADNEVCLPFPFVSDHHGEVRFDDRSASYMDLGSTNGTRVEGYRIVSHAPLPIVERLVVVIGTLTLAFRHREAGVQGSIGALATTTPASAVRAVPDIAARAPEPAAPVQRDRYAPPTLFPGSSGHGPEPSDRIVRDRLAPPTLFPPGAPRPQPQPVRDRESGPPSRAAGELAGRTPIVPWGGPPADRSPEPSIVAAEVERSGPSAAVPARTPTPALAPGVPLPGMSAGAVAADQHARLQKLAKVMCDELVRLRKTYEAFGRETGIRPFPLSGTARLHDLQDGDELIRYLTSSLLSDARLEELKRLFADMAAHQLALMGAILEGARGALQNVAPQDSTGGRPRLAIFEDKRWNENLERFSAFVEDDDRLQAAVFGPEFADAYAAARGK